MSLYKKPVKNTSSDCSKRFCKFFEILEQHSKHTLKLKIYLLVFYAFMQSTQKTVKTFRHLTYLAES